ncbi:AKIN gamma [Dorcoceras hygrometricum]|uniref:AKIN gamma n=1 Tax=Dorcoceras hygrometricum TaxID=472368 RepID=A0A2Z7AWM0_9LAMI|nr:AKIN gamma [Dorcoceras hygrometricum]
MTSALLIEEAEFSNHDISVADEEKKFISFAYVDSFAYMVLLKYKLKVAEIYVEEAGGSNRDVIITITRAVGTITRAVGTITEAVGTITGAVGTITRAVGTIKEAVGTITRAVGTVTEAVGTITTSRITNDTSTELVNGSTGEI